MESFFCLQTCFTKEFPKNKLNIHNIVCLEIDFKVSQRDQCFSEDLVK